MEFEHASSRPGKVMDFRKNDRGRGKVMDFRFLSKYFVLFENCPGFQHFLGKVNEFYCPFSV